MEFMVNEVTLGQDFSRPFNFLMIIIIPPMLHTHLLSGVGTLSPLVA